VSSKDDFRPVRPFTIAVAKVVKSFMSEHHITQKRVANLIHRDQAYISERVTGKRPFTTDEIDAIAALAGKPGTELLEYAATHVLPKIGPTKPQ